MNEQGRILITGATGNVGRELVQQLLETEQKIRVLLHNRTPDSAGNNIEYVHGDLSKPESLPDVLDGIDRMFLIMPGHGPEGPKQISNMIDAAIQAGVQQVIFQSSIGASLEPAPQIGQWHREAERAIRESGLKWTFLRPVGFMSNTLRWIDTIKSEGVVYSSTGEGEQAPIDPNDIAKVTRMALMSEDHEHKTFVLTGPELLRTKEQVEILSAVLDQPIRHKEVSLAVRADKMKNIGIPEFMVDALMEVTRKIRTNKVNMVTTAVKQITQQAPTDFETWCHKHKVEFIQQS